MSPTRHHWTPAEAEYRERVRAIGCLCCRMNLADGLKATGLAVEIHHATDCGRQIGNHALIPLCSWHHRAICIPGRTTTQMRAAFGPSLMGSKPFHSHYGGDDSLLGMTRRLTRSVA